MEIETDRTLIRPLLTDAEMKEAFQLKTAPDVVAGQGGRPQTRAEFDQQLKDSSRQEASPEWKILTLGIFDRATQKLMGTMSLRRGVRRIENDQLEMVYTQTDATIAYSLSSEFWGGGYMSECASALVSFAFKELGVGKIHSHVFDWNTPSRRIQEKLGFQQVSTQKLGGKTLLFFELTPESYIAPPGKGQAPN